MRKNIFFVGVFLWILGSAAPVHAQSLSYKSFHADITVQSDASILVRETIVVDFSNAHHGIFRSIPYRFTTTDGGSASIPITLDDLQQDGHAATYTTSDDGTNVVVKIGEADRTITGAHTYLITYTAQAAVNFFSDHDELYWNVTGDQWDAPLSNVSASVTFAPGLRDLNTTTPVFTQTACYTGAYGSTAQNCTHDQQGSTATFSSQDFLTLVAGFPIGIVSKPADFETLRVSGTNVTTTNALQPTPWLLISVGIIALVAGIAFLIARARMSGPADHRPIVPQYEPPKDVRPGEASVLLSTSGESVVISATIIDLAVRGYLRIEEKVDSVFLGLGHTKSFDLIEVKKSDSTLRPYESQLLDAIFRQPDYPATDGRISLSVFRNHRMKTYQAFADVSTTISAVGKDRGWYANGSGVLSLFQAITPSGKDLLWYLRGLRLYLQTAERYRLQWQEREHIFETMLPYAMVLGVAHAWSKALAPLMTKPPDWYQGDFSHGFNTVIFYSALSGLSTQVMSSAVSGAASSSSGFGGGGFSGGGGGGGGGGGW